MKDAWLDDIPGLDSVDGIRRMMGRREAFAALLRRFVVTEVDAIRAVRSALAGGRRVDAERAAHTLKGVAGTIGARQLQREAGELEAALRRGATAGEVARLADPAEQTLAELITAMLRAVPAAVEAEDRIQVPIGPWPVRAAQQDGETPAILTDNFLHEQHLFY